MATLLLILRELCKQQELVLLCGTPWEQRLGAGFSEPAAVLSPRWLCGQLHFVPLTWAGRGGEDLLAALCASPRCCTGQLRMGPGAPT